MIEIKKEEECRVCQGELQDVELLGEFYASDFVEKQPDYNPYPLVLSQCTICKLVQLRHTVSLDFMYRQYWYRSSLNKSMITDLKDVAVKSLKRVDLKSNDVVLDIGCNDATLFDFIPKNVTKVGFDPARNLSKQANSKCDIFINDYFNTDDYYQEFLWGQRVTRVLVKAKLITSIAMFYDLIDPMGFVESVKNVLAEEGIWVIQLTDLYSMMKINAFDNICHEHLEYYTLDYLEWLLAKFNLEVFDAEYNKVNGGSLRIYVAHKGFKDRKLIVDKLWIQENDYLQSEEGSLVSFFKRAKKIRRKIVALLETFNKNGMIIHALGASTKGNTLLQYYGLDETLIKAAAEINTEKLGLKTVGSNIPIILESKSLEINPNYYFVLPWHFKNTFVTNFKEYLEGGGALIFPLPEPHIVTSRSEYKL